MNVFNPVEINKNEMKNENSRTKSSGLITPLKVDKGQISKSNVRSSVLLFISSLGLIEKLRWIQFKFDSRNLVHNHSCEERMMYKSFDHM